ncbi:septum formation inhibitor Maf [Candidatus Woesearchaeota archaeon]|jgi:septum formation protein|nr:septum formation inhibitor Maf [Candidatus Woesearchaeota archaeon]
MKQKIILASTSPRRKGLLQQININFDIKPSKYEEDMTLKMSHHKLAMVLAEGKAYDVAKNLKTGIVIGADTFLVLKNKRIGKPKNKKEAFKTLKLLSKNTLNVYSGLAIFDTLNNKKILDYELTKIKFRKIEESEIKEYIKTKEPLDKAGSIAIQGIGAIFIEKIEGCPSNVIGLPLQCLCKNLKKLGISVFDYKKTSNKKK